MLIFLVFASIQFLLAGVSIEIGTGVVTGNWWLEGIEKPPTRAELLELFSYIIANLLKTLMFVSVSVFITTFFPGRLFLGPMVSIGMFFTLLKIAPFMTVKIRF